MKDKLKKLREELDLSKKKSLKIHKPIFRFALIAILALSALSLFLDGVGVFFGSQYLECPSDNVNPCVNPFYNEFATVCNDDLYCVETLQPGEILGDRPSFLSRNFGLITVAIILLSLLLNFAYFKQNKEESN